MRKELGKSINFRESGRRVTVLMVVIGGHLVLLMLLFRPSILYRNATPVSNNDPQALKLHFFRPPQPASPKPASSAHRLIAPAARTRKALSASSPKPRTLPPAADADTPPSPARSISAPDLDPNERASNNDGGFHERLHHAQRGYAVRGVPGSDTSFVPGIHMVDPMDQGIGAVMRTTQRLFGIKSGHCIDVAAWRQLSPQELSARHISPRNVDKFDQKYDCKVPPGLHF